MDDTVDVFGEHRELMLGVAYRVLGAMTEAEDVVQDAWLRWRQVDGSTVRNPRGYLVTVTTRLAIDRLRSERTRREDYAGPWLPEMIATNPLLPSDAADSVSTALLVMLETLSPAERAVFVLHEVFGFGYPEVAEVIERSEAATRQLGSRARTHVRERRRRFSTDRATRQQVTERFVQACLGGDVAALLRVLAPDVELRADTNGKSRGPRRPVFGADRVARLWAGAARFVPEGTTVRYLDLNGGPAALVVLGGQPIAAFVLDLDLDSGLIVRVSVIGRAHV